MQRVHVLVVEVPGWGDTRMRAEQELRRRGWVEAVSAGEADVLFVCGTPGPALASVCDRVWDQLPGPRARVAASRPQAIETALEEANVSLLNNTAQRDDASTRFQRGAKSPPPEDARMDEFGTDGEGMVHGGMSGAEGEDSPKDVNAMDDADGGHGEMGHGGMNRSSMGDEGMDMPMPGGVALAEGGTDRDGLDLDVLHVPLGPVLLHWPAGLVLRCALQGDVITDASVEVLAGQTASPGTLAGGAGDVGDAGDREGLRVSDAARRRLCARHCDSIGRLLALAGWEQASSRAFRVRDAVLEGMPLGQVAAELDRLMRRVGRSRVFAWSLRELPGVLESLRRWLGEARIAADAASDSAVLAVKPTVEEEKARLQELPGMVIGLDLAAARLVVAALAIDTAVIAAGESDHV